MQAFQADGGSIEGPMKGAPVPGHPTHQVLNQVRPLCDYNAFSCDAALRAGVLAHGGAWGEARLQQLGEAVGSELWQARASEAGFS